jgi:hypothetical protein
MQFKFFAGAAVQNSALGDREIYVRANSGRSDRVDDEMVMSPAVIKNYVKNPIVLEGHQPDCTVGNFEPKIVNSSLEGVLRFAPRGVSALADEICDLYKSGVRRAVSIGFRPIKAEPKKGGGVRYLEWDLLELSCVSVPCDPDALVIARSFSKAGRVLSGVNAAKLKDAHAAAEQCRMLVKDVLDGADCDDENEAKAAQQQRRRKLYALQLDSNPAKSKRHRQLVVLDLQMLR